MDNDKESSMDNEKEVSMRSISISSEMDQHIQSQGIDWTLDNHFHIYEVFREAIEKRVKIFKIFFNGF